MVTATESAYRARFEAVLRHIEDHLDGDLGAARLAEVAGCSKHHFQRQFAALFGLGLHEHVTRRRLKRASVQLAFQPDLPVIDVALANGFDVPETFARAFRRTFGQSPTEFRRAPDWPAWRAVYATSPTAAASGALLARLDEVRVVEQPEVRVAALEHRGDPDRLHESVRAFVAFRKRHRLPPQVAATYHVLHDDPALVPPEAFRMDLCVAVSRRVPDNPEGLVARTLPAGRHAVLRHHGPEAGLGDAIRALYARWLPASGETPGAFPVFVQRLRWFPHVSEHEACADVLLPLAS